MRGGTISAILPFPLFQLVSLRQRVSHRGPNILVARATAQVSAQIFANILGIGIHAALDHAVHSHQPSWRAISALQSMMLLEKLLQAIQSLRSIGSFESKNIGSLGLHG